MTKELTASRAVAGTSVLIKSMGRTDAIGWIQTVDQERGTARVRLPNWQADGVHLDTSCHFYELETGHGRAKRCRCCYCG